MFKILKARIEDIPQILPLVKDYWKFDNISVFDKKVISKNLKELLMNPNLGDGWIAIKNDKVIGYLLAVYVFSLENKGITAEIDEFFIDPKYRRNGIGIKLLKMAETEFINKKCTNVFLQLSRSNDQARNFYYRQGYSDRSGFELLEKDIY